MSGTTEKGNAFTWLPMWTLLSREFSAGFYRQKSRVIGALGTPAGILDLFWPRVLARRFPRPRRQEGRAFSSIFFLGISF